MKFELVWKKDTVVGTIIEDTYYTTRTDNNVFRMHNSFNISIYIIDKLEREGVNKIQIKYISPKDEVKIYYTSVEQFRNGWSYTYEDDPQLCVPIWKCDSDEKPRQRSLDKYRVRK